MGSGPPPTLISVSFFKKLARRTAALERVKWADNHQKGSAAKVLLMETMGSEDSCYEADKDGKQTLTSFKIKKLPWEGTALRQIKKRLDKNITRGCLRGHVTGLCLELYQRSRQNVTLLKFLNRLLMLKHLILIH